MKSRQRISIAQTQRLQLNLGLAASIRILTYDASGLTRYLEEQAGENPHLALEPAQAVPGEWLPRWTEALAGLGGRGGASVELAASAAPSLMAHVMQAVDGLFPSGRPRRLAVLLAEALEPSGWLGRPLAEIAAQGGATLPEAEAVLARLQGIEPTGLFARSLAECLRLQAVEEGCLDQTLSCMLAHLDVVAAGEFTRLARICAVTEAEIVARLRLIRGFDPKPGAQFDAGSAAVREPDLIVTRGEEGWQVALNRSALPSVRVSRPEQRPKTPQARAAWTQAQSLGRMVESRNATLLRVGREILGRQEAALEAGMTALVPMTMAEVAEAVDLHESTISRVVAGTSVDTPKGTWWLRRLFSGRIGEAGPSAAALRAALTRLVAAEDPAAPLSDVALTEALAAEGVTLARRTVAKYREMLNIPPASRRRRKKPGRAG
ncbi:MAG: RNA polymerase factor sigma-54 [Cereibacter changlensis]